MGINEDGRRLAWMVLSVVAGVLMAAPGSWGEDIQGIEFVPVGDPGNPAFDNYWRPMGAVDYRFKISKFEITREQYVEFLNTVDPTGANALGLWYEPPPPGLYTPISDFVNDPGAPEGQKYSLTEFTPNLAYGVTASMANDNVPVHATWYAVCRYANWLHNDKGGPGSTEGTNTTGAYDTRNFDDADVSTDPDTHNPGAKFWMTTEDEWVKAAFYARGVTEGTPNGLGYWSYPHGSIIQPVGRMPSGDDGNSANSSGDGFVSPAQRITVGSYALSESPYGLFDLCGNAHEWTETWFEGDAYTPADTTRMTRGGSSSWQTDHSGIEYRWPTHRKVPTGYVGFRIATVPEPATVCLLAVGLATLAARRRRRMR